MILYTDNQADGATVSANNSTVNYPPTNVQDSRLSRIFRGGEQLDFDISGSGSLKNISQAYTNLVQDPTDLTTGNWTLSNGATAVSSTETFQGLSMTELSGDGTSDPQILQSITVGASTQREYSIVLRNKNVSGEVLQCFLIQSDGNMTYTINFDNKNVIISGDSESSYIWHDNLTVEIFGITNISVDTSIQVRIDHVQSGSSTQSFYVTACQVVDNTTTFYPFIDGSKTADVIDETFTMPDRFTVVWKGTPNFAFDGPPSNVTISRWDIGAPQSAIIYAIGSDQFFYVWNDGGTTRFIGNKTFDDGTSFDNLNQELMIIASIDTKSGGINDSRFIVIPLESGTIGEDTTWTGAPDIKTSDFPTLSIGNENGSNQADSSYEYLRIYAGLLVGTVTDSDDVTELLKDKKLLFDKTYQQKLTATDLLIAGSTINDGDTITLRANNVDSFGSGSPLDETVTWSDSIITQTFTKSSYQYWRLSVNSSNVLDIGRLYLGESYTPPGITPTVTNGLQDAGIKTISASGQSYYDQRYFFELISVSFAALTHAEKLEIFNIFRDIGHGTPFFVTFDETCSDLGTRYVTINQNSLTTRLLSNPAYYSLALSLREEV
jgi:hypothetical protein